MRVAYMGFLFYFSSIIPFIFPKDWEFLGKTDGKSISITLSALYDKKNVRKERLF